MTRTPKENKFPYLFFGTGEIAVGVLNELERAGFIPQLVVTAPDKPAGRGKLLSPPPAKRWAEERSVAFLQPVNLNTETISQLLAYEAPVYVVVDYGAFLPKALLDIPPRGVLNMHPSLLPRLRGPSPIRSAILKDERETGISIMLVDEKMDHGPLVAQRKVAIPNWPPRGRELDALLAREGGILLANVLPLWVRGDIEAQEQNHDVATLSKLFVKEDGLLDLIEGDPYQNLLKIRAFDGWPGTYSFFEREGKKIRTQILDAHLENGKLALDAVKPEGKREMSYSEFLKSGAAPARM